jgi:hypothetical protein
MTCHSRLAAVLPLALLLLGAPPARAGEDICDSRIPANIEAGQLAPEILDMLTHSDTFRRQCLRIAAARVLRIRLGIIVPSPAGYRALTVIVRYEAGALHAEVTLGFAGNYVELLAHEFEHVLEQVDGVNLRAAGAGGGVWRLPDGAYETRRATQAGLQVLHEYEVLAAEAGRRRQLRLR